MLLKDGWLALASPLRAVAQLHADDAVCHRAVKGGKEREEGMELNTAEKQTVKARIELQLALVVPVEILGSALADYGRSHEQSSCTLLNVCARCSMGKCSLLYPTCVSGTTFRSAMLLCAHIVPVC